jgi:c-di-GMP-binding flagellar brake protein YcgR
VQLSAGQVVVCSCRLGQEVLRFTARVAAGDASPNATEKENPPLHLADIAELKVVQRRRYYRIGLAGRQPSGATCWLVEQRPGGLPRVCSQLEGQIVDVSESGIGVILVDDARLLEQAQGLQMWVRFTLPDENESLIFRAALRHMETSQGRSRVGLEFVEYVEPGQHQAVIDRLAKFAARTG